MMKCKYCGKEIDEGSLFCGYCGKEQPKVITCIKCGKELGADDLFCGYCGAKQVVDEAAEDVVIAMPDSLDENINKETEEVVTDAVQKEAHDNVSASVTDESAVHSSDITPEDRQGGAEEGNQQLPLPVEEPEVETSTMASVDQEESYTDDNKTSLTFIAVLIGVFVVIGLFCYFMLRNPSESSLASQDNDGIEQQDSVYISPVDSCKQEQEEQTIVSDDYVSYDLALLDLHGPVKSVDGGGYEGIVFDKNENIIISDAARFEGGQGWSRDESGKIVCGYIESYEYETVNGKPRLKSKEEANQGYGFLQKFLYDAKGVCVGYVGVNKNYDEDKGEWVEGTDNEVRYYDYKYDSHGNWTSRKTGDSSESRTITYYGED